MRKGSPHPLFIVCFVLAVFGGMAAAVTAFEATQCKPLDSLASDDCGAGNQVLDDTALVFAVSSLVLAVGAVGFQVGHANAPAQPPRVPFPPAAGPPYPGPAPTPPQQQPPAQG
jgi:hypothetical protein